MMSAQQPSQSFYRTTAMYVSAEDSGEEDVQDVNIDNFSRQQLLAEAEADIQTVQHDIRHIGIEENHDSVIEDNRKNVGGPKRL